MSSVEEIENRMNQTKNILHKCALEGQINIGLMLSDIEYLLNEIKNLVDENNFLHKEINERINFLNKLADDYYKSILKERIKNEISIYCIDKKFEIKGDKFKVFIKRKEYNDKMYQCILYLENYDILFYICNYEELRKEIIRRIENYLNERR